MAGKKRKASGRQPASKGPKEFNEKDGKLGPIRTFEDVADSEDEFHINRDKVMLDEGPNAKRQRKYEEDGMLYHAVSRAHWAFTNHNQMLSYNLPTKKF